MKFSPQEVLDYVNSLGGRFTPIIVLEICSQPKCQAPFFSTVQDSSMRRSQSASVYCPTCRAELLKETKRLKAIERRKRNKALNVKSNSDTWRRLGEVEEMSDEEIDAEVESPSSELADEIDDMLSGIPDAIKEPVLIGFPRVRRLIGQVDAAKNEEEQQ